MVFSPHNFLLAIKQLVTGDTIACGGFLRDIPLAPASIAITTSTRTSVSNGVPADAIVLDATGEDALVNFTVPRDYDSDLDHLKVVLLLSHVSGTSVSVNGTAVSKASPGAPPASVTAFVPATATVVDAAFGTAEVTADLSGLELDRNDSVTVDFAATAVVGAGVAHVVGARVEYRSTLVSHDEEDAAGDNLR